MTVCHALVQRILLEVAGIIPRDPCTSSVGIVMDPPANLDISPMFADDGAYAGKADEVLRTLRHWQTLMPSLGLRFSRLEAIPAAGDQSHIDLDAFRRSGCSINLTSNALIMKSPIGDISFCESAVGKRVEKALRIASEIVKLPKKHCALYLLRFQDGRMGYIKRTTPLDSCKAAFSNYDVGMREALETVAGRGVSEAQWQQLTMPTRHGGIGVRKAVDTADEAYAASLLATRGIR